MAIFNSYVELQNGIKQPTLYHIGCLKYCLKKSRHCLLWSTPTEIWSPSKLLVATALAMWSTMLPWFDVEWRWSWTSAWILIYNRLSAYQDYFDRISLNDYSVWMTEIQLPPTANIYRLQYSSTTKKCNFAANHQLFGDIPTCCSNGQILSDLFSFL